MTIYLISQTSRDRTGSYILKVFSAGLFLNLLFFSFFTYISNNELLLKTAAISEAGFFAVPTPTIAQTLSSFKASICGGVFFTLGAGAFVTLFSLVCVSFFREIPSGKKITAALHFFLSTSCLAATLSCGSQVLIPAYFVLMPAIITAAAWKLYPESGIRFPVKSYAMPLIFLAVMAAITARENSMINIRDGVFLSNPAGRAVNDFYYKYTLYPAEAFKSLSQKQLKTCHIKTEDKLLTGVLEAWDYLPVKGHGLADITISKKGNDLQFFANGKELLTADRKKFLASPGKILRDVSRLSDRNSFLRQFIYICIISASPASLYLIFFSLTDTAAALFTRSHTKLSSLICFAAGLIILGQVLRFSHVSVSLPSYKTYLSSQNVHERVAAIRFLRAKRMDILKATTSRSHMLSPHIAERYWYAAALGQSRSSMAGERIRQMLKDSHPNVVCQALGAMKTRGDRREIPIIKNTITGSDHWYVQWYGYNALKGLTWKQSRNR